MTGKVSYFLQNNKKKKRTATKHMICDIERSAVRTPEKPHCERLFSDQGSFIQAFQVLTMTAVSSFSDVTCRSICHLLSSHHYLSSSQWLSWKTTQFLKSLTSLKPPSHDDKHRSCNRAVLLLYSSYSTCFSKRSVQCNQPNSRTPWITRIFNYMCEYFKTDVFLSLSIILKSQGRGSALVPTQL